MRYLFLAITTAGALNFIFFLYTVNTQGGDAYYGKIEDGHYYLGKKGVFTEVSKERYERSKMLDISILISWPVVLASGYMYKKSKRRQKSTDSVAELQK